MRQLLVLALAAKGCLGQGFLRDGAAAERTSYGDQCPSMGDLGFTTYLQTVPWTFIRAVNVMRRSNIMQDASFHTFDLGGVAPSTTQEPSGWLAAAGVPNTLNREPLGQVRSTFSWTSTMSLYNTESNELVSHIVNPGVFWDTAQEIYDCQDRLLGSVTHTFNIADIFTGAYHQHEVLDASGNHIANLLREAETERYWGSWQQFVYMADLQGNPVASMRRPSGGWSAGITGEYFDVEIVKQGMNAQAPPPALNPEFVTLIFANELAGGKLVGPYLGMVIYPIIALMFLCCGFAMLRSFLETVLKIVTCCWCFGYFATQEKAATGKSEEKESLIEQTKEKQRDFWSCCSRRQAEIKSKGEEFKTKVAPKH